MIPIGCVYLSLYESLFIRAAPRQWEIGQLLLVIMCVAVSLPLSQTQVFSQRNTWRYRPVTHTHTHTPGRLHWEWCEVPGVIVLHFVHPGHLPTHPVHPAFNWDSDDVHCCWPFKKIYLSSLHHPFISLYQAASGWLLLTTFCQIEYIVLKWHKTHNCRVPEAHWFSSGQSECNQNMY